MNQTLVRLLTALATAATVHCHALAANEEALLAGSLQKLLTSAGASAGASPAYAVRNGAISIGKQIVRINPVLEDTARQADQFMLNSNFAVVLDGANQSHLSSTQVGIGSTIAEAADTAVQEWYLGFGQALLKAIAREREQYKFGDFAVYPGATGFRGQPPQGITANTDELQVRLLRAVAPLLPRHDGRLHALQVIVVVQPDSPPQGHVLLDGQASDQAAALAAGLRWPQAASSFMYKQAFLLR